MFPSNYLLLICPGIVLVQAIRPNGRLCREKERQKKAGGNFGNKKSFHSFVPDSEDYMDVRERIQEKAQELFWQYGIRSVSMDDIATHLGMSKKTIYQYFSDKDELVNAVVETELGEGQNDCVGAGRNAQDAVHEIFLTMDYIESQLRHMNPIVLYDLEKFHFKSFQKFQQYRHKFLYQVMKDNIERGIREELYRPDLNVDVMSKFRLESITIPFNITVFQPSRYNMADVAREIMEHFVYGLVTPKGYKMIQKYKNERTQKQPSNAKTK